MTQYEPQNDRDDIPPQHGGQRAAAPGLRRRGLTIAIILIATAAIASGAYRLTSGSLGGPARAQDPAARDNAPQLVKEGERITIPQGSPLRAKLVIATVADTEIQRTLVLPAVVEADPARTVKVS